MQTQYGGNSDLVLQIKSVILLKQRKLHSHFPINNSVSGDFQILNQPGDV